MSSGGVTSPSCTRLFGRDQQQFFLRLRRAEGASSTFACGGPRRADFFGILFRCLHLWSRGQQAAAAAAAATHSSARPHPRLALGRCHVRQAGRRRVRERSGAAIGVPVRFSQVLSQRRLAQPRLPLRPLATICVLCVRYSVLTGLCVIDLPLCVRSGPKCIGKSRSELLKTANFVFSGLQAPLRGAS